ELIILTAVDFVYINYNSINQEKINKVTLIKLKKYIEEGHFKEGSMLPKVLACMDFVEKTKRTAIIASLDNAALAFEKEQGTKIIY
ncbi:MAG: carbamate kinase, partial [Bacilli bacterium]